MPDLTPDTAARVEQVIRAAAIGEDGAVRDELVRLADALYRAAQCPEPLGAGEKWREFTIEPFDDSDIPAASLLCRSDDMCEEQMTAREGNRHTTTLGEWVDWARGHAAEHAWWKAADAEADPLTPGRPYEEPSVVDYDLHADGMRTKP